MILLTFAAPEPRAGALRADGRYVDLAAANGPVTVLEIIEGGERALDLVRELVEDTPDDAIVEPADVRLLAPVPRPLSVRDFLCFERHMLQGFANARKVLAAQSPDPEQALADIEERGVLRVPEIWYRQPIYYRGSNLAVCGPDTEVEWPRYSGRADFELEWGCFIGTTGKDIPVDRARDHIFGYTIFNDLSARDEQMLDMSGQLGPGKGKDFDDCNVMGPYLVTADELDDPYSLEMVVRVDGEEWGRGNTGEMHWRFEDCIAHVSRSETVHAGEFFGSGTVGDGSGIEHSRFLSDGANVELEVEQLGVLRTTIRLAT
jgi:2-keto-4-pentenoate hydratase/2-oxohepta-3-ene-1,7-dioic acid hydratase in catechol pathway